MTEKELNRLRKAAESDADLRNKLLRTESEDDPVQCFCDLCAEMGYSITPGGLFAYGMEMNDSKLRATNGGGSFEIDGWDDIYENFMDELRTIR